jgi:23S rRNA (uridine2552-2'-O)-methyltransferase
MTKRKARSGWMQEHVRDPYVRRARHEGRRSRASFKLAELVEAERLLRPGMLVLDLGAAPGGWSQYAAEKLSGRGRVLAVDLLPMPPLAGVEFIQGDLRDPELAAQLLERTGGARAGLVMSDMAPNITGIRSVDQPRSLELAEVALQIGTRVLAPGGSFVVKLFQGEGAGSYLDAVRRSFSYVRSRKPDASRARSREQYVVAKGFLGGDGTAAVVVSDLP